MPPPPPSLDQFTDLSMVYNIWQGPGDGVRFYSCKYQCNVTDTCHRSISDGDFPFPWVLNGTLDDMGTVDRSSYIMVRTPPSGGFCSIFAQAHRFYAKLSFTPVALSWAITLVTCLIVGKFKARWTLFDNHNFHYTLAILELSKKI